MAIVGTTCYHECDVEGMTDEYYVAIQKTVIYYHYDKPRLVTNPVIIVRYKIWFIKYGIMYWCRAGASWIQWDF